MLCVSVTVLCNIVTHKEQPNGIVSLPELLWAPAPTMASMLTGQALTCLPLEDIFQSSRWWVPVDIVIEFMSYWTLNRKWMIIWFKHGPDDPRETGRWQGAGGCPLGCTLTLWLWDDMTSPSQCSLCLSIWLWDTTQQSLISTSE